MQEEKRQFNKLNKVYLPGISRLLVISIIGFLFIQYFSIPVLAQSVKYFEGYNVITNDDGSKDIINGDFNFLRWDGEWRPDEELNISNGSWPYLYSQNISDAKFQVNDTTLNIPKANTQFKLKKNSISYNLVYSKAELLGKEKSINLTDAFIDFPYNLKSEKPKKEYGDKFNIRYDRFHFKAGVEHIAIHDDTPVDYIEDGKVYQDVTYLFQKDYKFEIDNGQLRLKFKKNALDKLKGNIIVEIRTWDIVGSNNSMWGQNVSFNLTTEIRATGNVELRQTNDDYALYTRFDEGNGLVIHNENTSNVLEGYLEGDIGNNSTSGRFVQGRYGQAFYFNGINNKVLFNDHPAIRLPFDFSISYFIKLAPGVDNPDTDIMRKGSTMTADPKHWWKVEIKNNKMQGVVFKNESSEIAEKDTLDRRDGNWHFVAYNRGGNTCSLIVDGSTVAYRTNCTTNATNNALLAIGAKDTYNQTTGLDFTNGTIDEVRMFNRNLTSLQLASIRNNTHFSSGTITRNLTSVILAGEELKELGCNGTWDRSVTKVNIMASTNNISWDTIQSNATNNTPYSVSPDNNYKYTRCSLSTTNTSRTPIIESIRARIDSKPLFYINGTVMDNVSKSGISGAKVSTNNNLSTRTNETGFYSFEVNSGAYNLTATFEPTYYPNSTMVPVSGANVVKNIQLSKKPTGNITGSVNS